MLRLITVPGLPGYVHRLQSFQRKMDAALVALAFDGSEEDVRGGLGYRHPERRGQPTEQHAQPYPAVLCCTVRTARELTRVLVDWSGMPACHWPKKRCEC